MAGTTAACGGYGGGATTDGTSASGDAGTAGIVAFLLRENKAAGWEGFDRPYFTERLESICPDCELIYSNAAQDAARRQP